MDSVATSERVQGAGAVGQGQKRQHARTLAAVVPKRDLARAEIAAARVAIAEPPKVDAALPGGEYVLALVDSVLYLARTENSSPTPGPRHARLRLAEAELAMAFGGAPFHSTLHLEHPAVGRLVVSLPTIEFAMLTEAAVVRVRRNGGW